MHGQQKMDGDMMPGGGMMAGIMGGGAGVGMASVLTAEGGLMDGGMAPHGSLDTLYGLPRVQYQLVSNAQ